MCWVVLAWQTMVGDDIWEWRPACLSESHLIPVTPYTPAKHCLCPCHCLLSYPCLTLGLINVNLIQLKLYFVLAMRNFRFTLNFFLLTLCLYFVLEGNKNVWPKTGVFYQTIFTFPYNV